MRSYYCTAEVLILLFFILYEILPTTLKSLWYIVPLHHYFTLYHLLTLFYFHFQVSSVFLVNFNCVFVLFSRRNNWIESSVYSVASLEFHFVYRSFVYILETACIPINIIQLCTKFTIICFILTIVTRNL